MGEMMTIEERLRQAQEQLAYWQQQMKYAEEQLWMWRGAVEALRGVQEYEQGTKGDGEEESAG